MRKIHDFKCTNPDCGVYTEAYVEDNITQRECPHCHCAATRVISAVAFKLDCSFPGYADKWARDHERGAKAAS